MTEEAVILQIAVVVFVALASGILLQRLKQPDIVGYVLTGVVLGPSGFALISSRDQVSVLAELGVLMLLFVIGLELNIQVFKKHFAQSVLCVVMQVAGGLVISGFISMFFHWPTYFTVALGFVLALSSTAVVVNTLASFKMTSTNVGSLTVGILIAQDIAAVPMILTLKTLTGGASDWRLGAKVLISVAFMALFLYQLGQMQKNRQKIPLGTLLGDNKDLYTLASLSVCFAAAAIAGGAGLTAPYGAFLAGLTLGNLSDRNEDLLSGVQPIQKILLMVFFLSIGLLLDLQFVAHHFWTICLLLIVVTVVKTVANIAILRILHVKLVQASFMGVAMAQLGEFSFLLITALGKQPDSSFEFAEKCLIALTVLSLMFSPMWLRIAQKLDKVKLTTNVSPRRLLDMVFGRTVAAAKINLAKAVEACERGTKILRKNLGSKHSASESPPLNDGDSPALSRSESALSPSGENTGESDNLDLQAKEKRDSEKK